jgi:hypothetical protein
MVAPRVLVGGITMSLASWFDPVSSQQGVATRIEECWANSNDKPFVLPIYQSSPPKNLLYPFTSNTGGPFPYVNGRAITYFSQNAIDMKLVLLTDAYGASAAQVGDSQICIQSVGESLTCNTMSSGVCSNTNEWTINNIKLTFPHLVPSVPSTCTNGIIDAGGTCQFSGYFESQGLSASLNSAGADFTVKYFSSGGNSSDHEIMCARITVCYTNAAHVNPADPCPDAVSRSRS